MFYLYVDVMLAFGDNLDVGIMDGLLVIFDAGWPVCWWPQNLIHKEDLLNKWNISSLKQTPKVHAAEIL